MILGGRLDGPEILTGRTVWFTSTDLDTWEFQGDFWAPGLYSMHEMPDLFRLGDWWYLLTTEYSDKSKTVYRMSRTLDGPWLAPADDAFDGRAYYAARSIADADGRRFLFGWVPTKENEDELASWQWGGTLVVHEAYQRPDGSLGVAIPAGVLGAFGPAVALAAEPVGLVTVDSAASERLATEIPDVFLFAADVTFAEGTRSFSVRLFENDETGDGYEFLVSVVDGRLSFDRRPNYPWFRYDNKGLERPLHLRAGVEHHIQVVADGTIATLYVDGVALNARMYAKSGTSIVVGVVDGGLTVRNATLAGLGTAPEGREFEPEPTAGRRFRHVKRRERASCRRFGLRNPFTNPGDATPAGWAAPHRSSCRRRGRGRRACRPAAWRTA